MAYTTINKSSNYFNTILWSGNDNNTISLTGVGFQPDLIWKKERNQAYSIGHMLYDSVRGVGVNKHLDSSTTLAEGGGNDEDYGYMTSIDSDGFSAQNGNLGVTYFNGSGNNYVAWNWLAGGTAVSNTDGDITSTVSANTTSGFSIVKWTGNGTQSDQEIGTGLSTELKFVIAKPLATGGATDQWLTYVNGVTDAQDNCLLLNSTNALTTGASGGTPNKGTTAGNLLIKAGSSTNNNLNNSGTNYIAYCFAEKKGFSRFGTYAGNGSTNGPFVYTGFKPAFVLIKNITTASTHWRLADNKRYPNNLTNTVELYPSTNAAESTNEPTFDFLSTGFKLRGDTVYKNLGSNTYIYVAFAENPLVGTNNVVTTAE